MRYMVVGGAPGGVVQLNVNNCVPLANSPSLSLGFNITGGSRLDTVKLLLQPLGASALSGAFVST